MRGEYLQWGGRKRSRNLKGYKVGSKQGFDIYGAFLLKFSTPGTTDMWGQGRLLSGLWWGYPIWPPWRCRSRSLWVSGVGGGAGEVEELEVMEVVRGMKVIGSKTMVVQVLARDQGDDGIYGVGRAFRDRNWSVLILKVQECIYRKTLTEFRKNSEIN